jgi:hypothetical protein
MNLSALSFPLAAILLMSVPAAAKPAPQPIAEPAVVKKDASIAFANHGGVWDWKAENSHTVYFQDRNKRWYRAELIGSAPDLPFVQFIGLDTKPADRLDRFSGIYVRGQHYVFKTFDQVAGPPPKRKR